MAYKRSDYVNAIDRLAKDNDGKSVEGDTDFALDSAVLRYSRDEPLWTVVQINGTGNRTYPLPAGWVPTISDGGFKAEYPVDTTAYQEQFMDNTILELYNTPSGYNLRWRGTIGTQFLPQVGEVWNLHFRIPYTLTGPEQTENPRATAVNTIPDMRFVPVVHLGASYVCNIRASRYAQQADRMGNSPAAADFRDKKEKFDALAKSYEAIYKSFVMPPAEDIPAAFSFGTFKEDPLHREQRPEYPVDASGRLFTDV